VIIRYEMIHETRIVPLDGRSHVAPAIRSYMGDARGRWDGDSLTIETTNFNGKTGSYGRNGNGNPTSEALRLVERFTLLDANTLQYEVTSAIPRPGSGHGQCDSRSFVMTGTRCSSTAATRATTR
jgi:hypothetical protein